MNLKARKERRRYGVGAFFVGVNSTAWKKRKKDRFLARFKQILSARSRGRRSFARSKCSVLITARAINVKHKKSVVAVIATTLFCVIEEILPMRLLQPLGDVFRPIGDDNRGARALNGGERL